MSKQVKELLRNEIVERIQGVGDVAVVSVIGIDGKANNRLRRELRQQGIGMMVVKNAMAHQALTAAGMDVAQPLIEGPSALVYGGESVIQLVRELLKKVKDVPQLTIKGAVMEGEVFGADRIEALSKFPTRIEALGRISGLAKSPGAKLVAAVLAPGSVIAGILKTIQDKQKDAGEPAAA